MIDDLCILTCTYKRPYLIDGLLKSWITTNADTTNNVAIVENSPGDDVAEYLDSVGIQYARFINQPHTDGIIYGMQHIIQRYVLILDTDILFYRSVATDVLGFIESGCAIGGEYCSTRGAMTHPRIHPWFCLVDMRQINDNGIRFAREVGVDPSVNGYDTGSSFLEDILAAGLTRSEISLQPHKFIHYEGMSWRQGCGETIMENMDADNERNYMIETRRLHDVSISGFYNSVLG